MGHLDEYVSILEALPQAQRDAVVERALQAVGARKWVPNPGPQTDAYFSEADILLFGGEPGGGKSGLLTGLALNEHERSLIMRRQYTDLAAIIEDTLKAHGSRDGYNGSAPPQLKLGDGRIVDFGAAARVGDEQHWQGNPHDFIGLDEGTQFAYQQVRFLMGWLRSVNPGQRKRVVIATNPPLTTDGLWVHEMFAPWLDPKHRNPAKQGELRWFVTSEDGRDVEVDGPGPVEIGGKTIMPLSRTFIASSLSDNPYLAGTGYDSQLNNMIEPYRSILMGGFKTSFKDQDGQVIPTAWIRMAMERWTPNPPDGIPMCSMAVDCSGGGEDPMIISTRHDGWYAPMIEIPAKDIPADRAGTYSAGVVVSHRRDGALVIVDMGGGYGGPLFEHLSINDVEVQGYKGASASSGRTKDRKLGFWNKRSEAIWRFREALDPDQPGGSPIMLPDDSELLADLAAPTLDRSYNGIKVETKEAVIKRLGRSTNKGDAAVMAWTAGATLLSSALDWVGKKQGLRPQVVMGRHNRR